MPGIHSHLREWRKSRRLTLSAVANLIDSKTSTVAGWETGRRAVDLEDLDRLAKAYGVHPAALLFAPDVALEKVNRMQLAGTLAERMDSDVAAEWLAMGRRLAQQIATKVDA